MLIEKKEEILELMDRFEKSSLFEMEIETEELSLRLKKQPPAPPAPAVVSAPAASAAAPVLAPAGEPAAPSKPAASDSAKRITSPIVGVYYSAPSPDADAFVKVGDSVKAGDVICIVEAMKMMNEITSEYSGIVRELPVNNGDTVEYGQVLAVIE